MKVVFLDVDGVLNIMSQSYNSHGYDTIGSDPIEPHLMKRLEFIMERVPDANIVISSSWFMEQLNRRLKQRRFKYLDRIIDRTPRNMDLRGNQIQEWLDDHNKFSRIPLISYIVLEDEISDVCGDKCAVIPRENVIEVNMNEGLSNRDTIEAIDKLNNITITDGMVVKLNERNYDLYYKQGFRPSVNGNKEELINRWERFTIDRRNLLMKMEEERSNNEKCL